jgi:hypothetical protein
MTSQATNRREGGFASCLGRSRKLLTYTKKELENAWAAPELLGAPSAGGARGGGGGDHRSQISLQSRGNRQKR